MRVAILGGGVGGLSLAWFLAESMAGKWQLEVFERESAAGGLVRGFSHRGIQLDRHYHVVLVSDDHLRALVAQLGIAHLLRFHTSRMGFYDGKALIPFNNPLDLLRFPLLSPLDKARLVATLLYCQHLGDAHTLHHTPLEPWLTRLGGSRAFQQVWAPLLRSKFDGSFDGMPATYLWGRMRRMGSTREAGGAVEKLGILKGGTTSLVQALAQQLPDKGVLLRLGSGVQAIEKEGEKYRIRLEGASLPPYDLVISTLATPLHDRLAAPAGATGRYRLPDRYLGIVDVVLALDRSLTPFYTLNLLDPTLPFTGVIETTHLLDPGDHGDAHMVYLPRYTDAKGPLYQMPDEEVKALFLSHLGRIFPTFGPAQLQGCWVFREPFVEPVHTLGGDLEPFPESLDTCKPRVYLMNTGRLYPLLHNCQAVIGLARRTADYVRERHG